jgi:hypothetical protein
MSSNALGHAQGALGAGPWSGCASCAALIGQEKVMLTS